jgi:hypothetical protein
MVFFVKINYRRWAMLKKVSEFFPLGKKDAELPEPEGDALGGLHLDVQLMVFTYFTVQELCHVARVSKYWNALSSLNTLWRSFSERLVSFPCQSYKDIYKMTYTEACERKKNLNTRGVMQQDRHLLQAYLIQPPLIPPPLRFTYGVCADPLGEVDMTIYASDLHPFDDTDPSTGDTQGLGLLR